jgi:glycosyltransferase involved in cell wall biosynthesis
LTVSFRGYRVAVLFETFGPYHLARLNALGSATPTLGIELCARSPTYDWDPISEPTSFERVTLYRDKKSVGRSGELETRIADALTGFRPDAVLVPGWATKAAFAILAWAIARKVPAVVMSESTAHDSSPSWPRNLIKRTIVTCFTSGLVGGSLHQDYLTMLGLPKNQIFVGYDVVDNDYFDAGANAARLEDSRFRACFELPERYILASARFVPIKNLVGLIEAYSLYRRKAGRGAADLVILGDGPERPRIVAAIASNGLEPYVHLSGFRQYNELPTYYGLAEAFVHVSLIEPWGLVVNEAMAAGLPVLVSRTCGCASDLVEEGGNGFVVDPLDAAGIARRLAQISEENGEFRGAMGRRSRELIAQYPPARFASGALFAVESAIGSEKQGPALLQRVLFRGLTHFGLFK